MQKKIIHLDLDYFFCQVELLTRPELRGKPVAIGYDTKRSVLCTANYIARKYGVGSAMPVSIAKRRCPDLIILEPQGHKYREYSQEVFDIFHQYTDIIEGLSLDEAFLDVSESERFFNSATLMAKDIRAKVLKSTGLTLSAGVSENKLIAKIACGYRKPNALTVVPPSEVQDFIKDLSVKEIWGVGHITFSKLKKFNIHTFQDLRAFSKDFLFRHFGSFGERLYDFSRGIDHREVESCRERKSLSVERTFYQDIFVEEDIQLEIKRLYESFRKRLERYRERKIKSLFIKLKSQHFEQTTSEKIFTGELNLDEFYHLLKTRQDFFIKGIRLVGIGVRFKSEENENEQLSFCLAS